MTDSKVVTRPYVVKEKDEKGALIKETLMDGSSRAQAIAKVVSGRFDAAPATARDVQRIMGAEQKS